MSRFKNTEPALRLSTVADSPKAKGGKIEFRFVIVNAHLDKHVAEP